MLASIGILGLVAAIAGDVCPPPARLALNLGDGETRRIESFPYTACVASETEPVCAELTRAGRSCDGQIAVSIKSADRAGAIYQVRKATAALVSQLNRQGLQTREPGLPQVVRVGQHFFDVVQTTDFTL